MDGRLETVSYKTGLIRTSSVGLDKPIIDATGMECPVCKCHEVWAWEKQAQIVDVDLVDGSPWDKTFYWEVVDTYYTCTRCENVYTSSEIIAQKRREIYYA